MRKRGGTPSRRDKHVTLAAISPPGVARGRFVGGQQSGLAGCKPPPLFTRGASSCSSQGRSQGEPWGASPRPSAPSYLPDSPPPVAPCCLLLCVFSGLGCLRPWRLVAPPAPPLFFPPPPSLRPRCLLLCVFSGLGCLGPWRLVAPPPPPPPPGVSCCPARGALGLCRPPLFFFLLCFLFFLFPLLFSLLFLPVVRCGAGLCVFGRQVCPCVPRWCCPCRCAVCAGWCCVVLAVGPG